MIIPKAAVPILRLFDKDHESSESGYAVPVGSIRWTAREESLCCSFLQTQMQTRPNDKKDQLLRATSVYLVTEGYFRNPKRIYTHLWEKARHLGSQGAYVSRTKKARQLDHVDMGGATCVSDVAPAAHASTRREPSRREPGSAGLPRRQCSIKWGTFLASISNPCTLPCQIWHLRWVMPRRSTWRCLAYMRLPV